MFQFVSWGGLRTLNWIPFHRNKARRRDPGVCSTCSIDKYSLVIHPSGGQIKPPEKCDVDIWFSAPERLHSVYLSYCAALLVNTGSAESTPNLYISAILKILISISWSKNYTETVYHRHLKAEI